IADADVKGPFTEQIPRELPEQAKLPELGYTSPLEKLAERFHAAPALMKQLNPEGRFTAGTVITVPGVQPFEVSAPKPAPDPAAADLTIQVTRDDSSVKASRSDGTIVFYAPVTTGSEHDPLPTGDYKVASV